MDILIVGGNFGYMPKSSSVVSKINDIFEYRDLRNISIDRLTCINGGDIVTDKLYFDNQLFIAHGLASQADLVIWMPNISNEAEKDYPAKKPGAILICSKVMREGYTRIDAISRIFKMHGNAVITIYKEDKIFRFELIDALGNIWYNGTEIIKLCWAIEDFVNFTQSAKRVQTRKRDYDFVFSDDNKNQIHELIDANKRLQEHIMTACGNRFFGNISTRCTKLFPSMRNGEICMFVSPRNVDKSSITPDMMVPYFEDDSYMGDRKPSVDSPAQVRLYQAMPNINYMIHGHAEIISPNIRTTDEYKLCGDINEVDEVLNTVNDNNATNFIVNLKNHGFLIGASDITCLNNLLNYIINQCDIKITNQDN